MTEHEGTLHWGDGLVLAGYFIIVIAIGIYVSYGFWELLFGIFEKNIGNEYSAAMNWLFNFLNSVFHSIIRFYFVYLNID